MYRSVALSFVLLAVVAAVRPDNILKCYMCTSLTNEACDSDVVANALQPVECTSSEMVKWQRSIQQHQLLNQIAWLFEIDESSLQDYRSTPHNVACAKMILNVSDQNVTVKTCQTAKTELIDPCKAIEDKLKNHQLGKMEQCALCLKQACNAAIILSPKILYVFLSFLAIFIHIAFYHRA